MVNELYYGGDPPMIILLCWYCVNIGAPSRNIFIICTSSLLWYIKLLVVVVIILDQLAVCNGQVYLNSL